MAKVELLMAMGFPADEAGTVISQQSWHRSSGDRRGWPGMALKVQRALEYAYDNVEQAATYLMEGREQWEQLSDPPSRHLRVDT